MAGPQTNAVFHYDECRAPWCQTKRLVHEKKIYRAIAVAARDVV